MRPVALTPAQQLRLEKLARGVVAKPPT